jgi:hypothetical protein
MAFAAAVGEPRAEGLCRIDPADLGRLIGLDRAPEPKTLRRRLGELAAAGRCGQLLAGLARHHVAANGVGAALPLAPRANATGGVPRVARQTPV